jgi:hypothetical protein
MVGALGKHFTKIHKAHKLPPVVAARITDKLWSIDDVVKLVRDAAPKPGKRGPCKNRAA